MPRYDYVCPEHGPETITKAMRYASDPEPCPRCEIPMQRVYGVITAHVAGGTPIHHDRAWLRGPGGKSQERRP